MPAFNEPRSTARIWLWTTVVVVLISLVLAPTHDYTICVDNYSDPALSYCESYPLSLAGNRTHVWAWLAALTLAALTGWLAARRHKTRPHD
ncbi:hypothetical protein [Pseudoclavibacter helvolus]|uniref:Uncharacterized protein n=1 Tax=Pseudoclavibacter helvolus TaxID=255205 RepID=A0A7W4UN45_9MICO|nr:hypothetical protein [Pseudoclavibacter helvolus]MBB2957489.1 hypothetical protein [Pseudoclavibacter helvolus]